MGFSWTDSTQVVSQASELTGVSVELSVLGTFGFLALMQFLTVCWTILSNPCGKTVMPPDDAKGEREIMEKI